MKSIFLKYSTIAFLFLGLLFQANFVFASSTIGSNILTTGTLTADGALKFTSGASDKYILTTDASGNATWISVGNALSNAGLGVGSASGTAPLDGDGLVPMTNLPVGVPGGIATLDGTGKVSLDQLPSIALTNTFVVGSESAMLALSATIGDVAIRTDQNETYILSADPATTLSNWLQILSPIDTALKIGNNLSDLSDVSIARTNLGLGTLATQDGNISDYLSTSTAASTYVPYDYASSTFQTKLSNPLTGSGVTNTLAVFTSSTTLANIPAGASGQILLASTTAPYGVEWGFASDTSVITNWGSVLGTLSDQTDLQAALDAKLSTTSAASIYLAIADATSTYPTFAYASSTYLTTASLDGYLSTTTASTTYLTIANATSTFPTFGYASSTFQPILTNPVTGTGATSTLVYWSSMNSVGTVSTGADGQYLQASSTSPTGFDWVTPASSTQWTTSGNNIYYNVPSGNVGIGTNNPVESFEVGSTYGRAFFGDGAGVNRQGLLIVGADSTTQSKIQAYNYQTLSAKNLSLNASGGNVSIGTTTGSVALEVYGTTPDVFAVSSDIGRLFTVTKSTTTISSLGLGLVRSTSGGELYTDNTSYISSAYASSTFPSFSYASSTYLTSASLDAYLSTTTASSTYLKIADAASTYPSFSYASSTYATISSLDAYLSTTTASTTYAKLVSPTFTGTVKLPGSGSVYLGTSGAKSISLTSSGAVSTLNGSANQILGIDASNLNPEYKTFSGTDNITVTNGVGSVKFGMTGGAAKSLSYWASSTALGTISPGADGTFLMASSTSASGFDWGNVSLSAYLSTTTAAATYATISSLGAYLSTTTASSTYLKIADASSTYYLASNPASYITAAALTPYLSTTTAAATYATISSLGAYLSTTTASTTYAKLAGAVFTGAISATNLSGTNSGDVTLVNNINGLTISGQALTMALAGPSATGTLSATDWNTFNSKGTVSSVNTSGGTTGLTFTGGPITTTGTTTLGGTLIVANGGTGATSASTARSNLSAAQSGANSDITSLSGLTTPLSASQGGTGTTTGASMMMFSGNSQNTKVNNTTLYCPLFGGIQCNATDASAGTRNIVSRAGTIKNLYVILGAALVGKTGSLTVTKNGVDTGLAVTLDGLISASDTVHSFTVSPGDEVGVRATTNGNVLFSWAADFTW